MHYQDYRTPSIVNEYRTIQNTDQEQFTQNNIINYIDNNNEDENLLNNNEDFNTLDKQKQNQSTKSSVISTVQSQNGGLQLNPNGTIIYCDPYKQIKNNQSGSFVTYIDQQILMPIFDFISFVEL
ncbi:hypothetical protein PPERSA_02361 [Pseudocohnilembus persalinus]|uniref:Uncharacterized protein n=1 Tax=Pseudocohnilembus persalinus TaxID=266149 RepID=A0A0V0QVC8_PSEPJ|nr:hypothetical protein PPERSA_02361 [Pseudocohnilembus persalinus]|eukprot:KRX05829.1 hypothetical protein PPERSA_02361 [Pseudocohnilembus persalinus]